MADSFIKSSHFNTSFFNSPIILLIALNVGMALLGLISWVAGRITDGSPDAFRALVSLPANIHSLASQPWTLVTYMFYHASSTHLAANISVLSLIILATRKSDRTPELFKAYILGGLGGALAFLIFSNLIAPQLIRSSLSGASAAVLGVAGYLLLTNHSETISFRGVHRLPFPLIPVAFIIPALLLTPTSAAGATAAHIGGLCAGLIFSLLSRKKQTENGRAPILSTNSNKLTSNKLTQ